MTYPGGGRRSPGGGGGIPRAPTTGPLRPSDIKYAIYGRAGYGPGLWFDRILLAGWTLHPSIGLVAKDIHKLGLNIRTYREPLTKAVRLVMMPSIAKNFQSEGRPDRWTPLADYTVQIRGTDHPILTRSGALGRAASSFGVWSISASSATIKHLPGHVWYGNLHQEGYGSIRTKALRMLGGHGTEKEIAQMAEHIVKQTGKFKTTAGRESKFVIPQREFVLFQEEDKEAIQELFADWMEAQADKVGRGWGG
jgi:phage gpG-like protein